MANDKAREALREYQEKVKSGEIERTPQKTLTEKWQENKKSLRASVNAMCFACFGGEQGDNVTREIKDCTCLNCPLYQVRPYK